MTTVDQIYTQHIQPLSATEQLQLLQRIAAGITPLPPDTTQKLHSITELHGLGASIWTNVDVDQYVNDLRNEWDLES